MINARGQQVFGGKAVTQERLVDFTIDYQYVYTNFC